MTHLLIVKADTNDGDYVTKITELDSDSKHFNRDISGIEKVIDLVKNYRGGYNWPTNEIGDLSDAYDFSDPDTEQLIEWFDDNFVSHGEYGTHTLESVQLIEVTSRKYYL